MAEAERQLAVEGAQRRRVGACAVVSGLLLFAGDLWGSAIQATYPTVGLLQGLSPALHGLAAATTDPRTAGLHFEVSHQTALIISTLVAAVGTAAMVLPLVYLAAAERLRSPAPSTIAPQIARYAPLVLAIASPAYTISLVVGAHSYLSGTARTAAAVTNASGGGARLALGVLLDVGELALAAAFIMIALRAMRVGLLTRMMGIFGIISGVLFVIPVLQLPIVQALWLVFVGATLIEFGGRPLPEAWSVAEARPWPTPPPKANRRPARGWRSGTAAAAAAAPPPAPEPVVQRGPSPSASKKRKRRR